MITRINSVKALYFLVAVTAVFTACKKEISGTTDTTSATTSSTSSVIAVASNETSTTGSSASTDSVYILQPCDHGSYRDSIAASDLPATITTYLDDNYSGYTFSKGFEVKDSSGTILNYVVIIYYNDKPVALLFDSSGNFVKVLEQREKSDLGGPGWHEGGRFCDRDGLHKDTIALSALPAAVLSYIADNYPEDTLIKAFQNRNDSSYIVISKDNGLFATVFDASGNFVKRISLPAPSGYAMNLAQGDLPDTILSYLDTTYPNYVFDKAFAVYRSNSLQGYVVIINANNTDYAVRFDSAGNFVAVRTIW